MAQAAAQTAIDHDEGRQDNNLLMQPTYGKHGKFQQVPSAATGDLLGAWFVPAAAAEKRGNILLVHGVTSHARYEWFSHPECQAFDELWRQRKRSAAAAATASTATGAASSSSSALAGTSQQPGTPEADNNCCDFNDENVVRVHLNPDSDGGTDGVHDDEQRTVGRVTLRAYELPEDLATCTWPAVVEGVFQGGWAQRLSAAGWNVCLYDQQGHGVSGGCGPCNVRSFNDIVGDCLQLWDLMNREWPRAARRCLCGLSMGGLVIARALEVGASASWGGEGVLPTDAILLAPALGLEAVSQQGVNRLLHPIASALAKWTPHMRIVQRAENNDYVHIERLVASDPLCHQGKLPCRICTEMLNGSSKAQADAQLVPPQVAVLLCHSQYDTMCDPQGSLQWLRKLGQVKRRKLWLLDDGWHFLTTEPPNELLLDRILTRWLN